METDYLVQSAVDEMAAAVIREAYNDLVKALLFDEMLKHAKTSFNCYTRIREFTRDKRCRIYNHHTRARSLKDQLDYARRDIAKLEQWFVSSERYKILTKSVKGEWYVMMAHKKVGEFCADKLMEIDLSVLIKDRDANWYEKKKSKWVAERDEWRKARGLEEVKDV